MYVGEHAAHIARAAVELLPLSAKKLLIAAASSISKNYNLDNAEEAAIKFKLHGNQVAYWHELTSNSQHLTSALGLERTLGPFRPSTAKPRPFGQVCIVDLDQAAAREALKIRDRDRKSPAM